MAEEGSSFNLMPNTSSQTLSLTESRSIQFLQGDSHNTWAWLQEKAGKPFVSEITEQQVMKQDSLQKRMNSIMKCQKKKCSFGEQMRAAGSDWKEKVAARMKSSIADFGMSADGKVACLVRDLASRESVASTHNASAARFVAFEGYAACRDCYMAFHGVHHEDVENAWKALKNGETQLDVSYQQRFFPLEVESQRASVKLEACTQFVRKWCVKNGITTSRDGDSQTLPFRPICSFLEYESSKDDTFKQALPGGTVSSETFRAAFKLEMKNWNLPRFKSECKACSTCWTLFQQLHLQCSKGMSADADDTRSVIAKHQEFAYKERQAYYKDREEAALPNTECCTIIVDFTFSISFPFLYQRTGLKDETEKMELGFGVLLDHGPAKEGGGTHFALIAASGGKDNANAVCSFIFNYLTWKRGVCTFHTLKVQLDSSSSNKCSVIMYFFSWIAIRFGLKIVYLAYLIAGHTGEDVDGAGASLRIALRHNGNVWSPATLLGPIYQKTYQNSRQRPYIWLFHDFALHDAEEGYQQPAQFMKYGHFLYDFDEFFEGKGNTLKNFTYRNAQRTEFSIHNYQLWPEDDNVSFKGRLLRGFECPWSNTVKVFQATADLRTLAQQEPKKLYFHDPDHKLSKGVDLQKIKASVAELLPLMPDVDREWWDEFFSLAQACGHFDDEANGAVAPKHRELAPRQVDPLQAPVFEAVDPSQQRKRARRNKAGAAAAAPQEAAPQVPVNDIAVVDVAQGAEIQPKELDPSAVAIDHALEAQESADAADQLEQVSMEGADNVMNAVLELEEEGDGIMMGAESADLRIAKVLARRATEDGFEYQVSFEGEREDDDSITKWTSEAVLTARGAPKENEAKLKAYQESLRMKSRGVGNVFRDVSRSLRAQQEQDAAAKQVKCSKCGRMCKNKAGLTRHSRTCAGAITDTNQG